MDPKYSKENSYMRTSFLLEMNEGCWKTIKTKGSLVKNKRYSRIGPNRQKTSKFPKYKEKGVPLSDRNSRSLFHWLRIWPNTTKTP